MKRWIVALCVVMVVVSMGASAEEPSSASNPGIDDAVAAWKVWVENDLGVTGVPGASYAFVQDDRVLVTGGIGFADPTARRPADADTLYSICSISKLFTSIAVMQLRDAGQLRLDDDLAVYVPWFATLNDTYPDDEPVSIRNVLSHSAGLPRESDYPYWAGPDFDFPTTAQIRERLPSQESLYPSGRYFQYSNLGLSLLGVVVDEVTGRSWAEVVHDDILAPLKMDDTYTSVPKAYDTGRLAAGFAARRGSPDRERLPLFDVEGIGPAAGMASSASDLAKFARWQLRLRADGGDEVLRAATLREMQRVHWVDPDWETTWGLGFTVANRNGTTWVYHGGHCPGYRSEFAIVPEKELGIVVLTNAINSNVRLYTQKALSVLGPAVEAAATPRHDPASRDADFEQFVGVYDSVWGRTAIVLWGNGIAAVDLEVPALDRDAWVLPLRRIEGDDFRRVRSDDGSLGEPWTFGRDADGDVVSVTWHSVPMTKVR